MAELEALKLMPDEDICLDDEDCPAMSPSMQKSYECAVAMRNRMRKNGKLRANNLTLTDIKSNDVSKSAGILKSNMFSRSLRTYFLEEYREYEYPI